MHRDDGMTPKERQNCLRQNQDVDRQPIAIIFSSAAKKFFAAELRL